MLFELEKLKKIGKNVQIGDYVKIVNPEVVEIDDFSRIDDFSLLVGGEGIIIGKFVHIASFCSVIGSGFFVMEDLSTLAAGCRIITGSDDYKGRCLTNPCTPIKYRQYAYRGKVILKKHVILGTNTIVHPNVTIQTGAATGSNTVVTRSLDEWGIYVGSPARRIETRESETIMRMEKDLFNEIYGREVV